MKEYKALQIIKHALAYYIAREGATETDTNTEKLLLAEIEERIENLRERYRIPEKKEAEHGIKASRRKFVCPRCGFEHGDVFYTCTKCGY